MRSWITFKDRVRSVITRKDKVRSSVIRVELGAESLLLHTERNQLKRLRLLLLLSGALEMSHQKRHLEEDPGHPGGTMSLGWPGKTLESHQISYRR